MSAAVNEMKYHLDEMSSLVDRLGAESAAWRQIAVALTAVLAENGYDPNSDAVAAYNHARNGRMAEAIAVLQ